MILCTAHGMHGIYISMEVGHTKRSPLNFPMRRASPPYKMADESTYSKINRIFTSRPPSPSAMLSLPIHC